MTTARRRILGKPGRWDGADVIRILLEQPAIANRLAWRLCDTLHGRGGGRTRTRSRPWATDCGRITSISAGASRRCSAPGPSSPRRISGRACWGPSSSSSARCAGSSCSDPPPSTLVLADWSARLGQDLFNPPNVGGWPGGRSWLSARSLIGRANFAAALVEGRGVGREAPLDPAGLAQRYGRGHDGTDAVRLLRRDPDRAPPPTTASSSDCGRPPMPRPRVWDADATRGAAARLIAAPDSQLG